MGLDDFGANFSSSLPVTHHLFWIQGSLYIHIPLFHIYSRLMLWVILNLFGELIRVNSLDWTSASEYIFHRSIGLNLRKNTLGQTLIRRMKSVQLPWGL